MDDYLSRFNNAPADLKKAFFLLVGAWCCHPLFIYSLFSLGTTVQGASSEIIKMAVVSLCLCVLLFTIKKWARALVVMGGAFIVINDLFYLLVIPTNKLSTVLCVIVVLFSGAGTFLLFKKDSRDYYTQLNPKSEPFDPANPGGGIHQPRK